MKRLTLAKYSKILHRPVLRPHYKETGLLIDVLKELLSALLCNPHLISNTGKETSKRQRDKNSVTSVRHERHDILFIIFHFPEKDPSQMFNPPGHCGQG